MAQLLVTGLALTPTARLAAPVVRRPRSCYYPITTASLTVVGLMAISDAHSNDGSLGKDGVDSNNHGKDSQLPGDAPGRPPRRLERGDGLIV